MDVKGIAKIWLAPRSATGLIMTVEGTVDAELYLIIGGTRELTHQWHDVALTEKEYISPTNGAQISLLYADMEHDYDEPGYLKVSLTGQDGTTITGELDYISLHPTVLT
jgi:hypothetical protein